MNTPAYMLIHRALSLQGRATRTHTAVEAMLAECRRCDQWNAEGCGKLTTREFAALLADGGKSCKEIDKREPKVMFEKQP